MTSSEPKAIEVGPWRPGGKIRFAEYDKVVKLARAMHTAAKVTAVAHWPRSAAQLAHSTKWAGFFEGIISVGEGQGQLFHALLDGWPSYDCSLARRVAKDRKNFTFAEAQWTIARVGSNTVVWSSDFAGGTVWSPVAKEALLAGVVDDASVLAVDQETGDISVFPDRSPLPDHISELTRRAIEATERTPGPRSWMFYGPPGGGKTTAARQLAEAVGNGSRVTLAPGTIAHPSAWALLATLKPRALVLDDVDSEASDSLLDNLDRARNYADVIVLTANTLKVRGALLRPGRVDEAPVLFETVDAATARAIAPTVPEEKLRAALEAKLLAAYLSELELRHLAGRDLDEAICELVARQKAAGER